MSGYTSNSNDLAIGCSLAIGGNLLISVSLNLQKYTHLRNASSRETQHYMRKPIWWFGLSLMALGEVGNFSAYGFAPASLVAPLGTTTVLANMFIAVLFLGEKIRRSDIIGSVIAVIGAVLLVNFSSKNEEILDADHIIDNLSETAFIVYAVVEIFALGVLFLLKYKYNQNNVIVLILICSLLASFTVISAKALSGMIQITLVGTEQIFTVVFWGLLIVMLVTAIAQVKFLNQAMKLYESTLVVPTNFVFFTISAIVAGVVFYKEFWGMATLDIIMFLFGCILCFIGVYFITSGHAPPSDQTKSPNKNRGPILNIFPAWLFSYVKETGIQPHKSDIEDERPIVQTSDPNSSVDHVGVSIDTDSSESEPTVTELERTYGSTKRTSKTRENTQELRIAGF